MFRRILVCICVCVSSLASAYNGKICTVVIWLVLIIIIIAMYYYDFVIAIKNRKYRVFFQAFTFVFWMTWCDKPILMPLHTDDANSGRSQIASFQGSGYLACLETRGDKNYPYTSVMPYQISWLFSEEWLLSSPSPRNCWTLHQSVVWWWYLSKAAEVSTPNGCGHTCQNPRLPSEINIIMHKASQELGHKTEALQKWLTAL